ncbi:MAG TPA: FAD-dependent oxidoreductase [Ignavibacteriales bacterium]|nr:FAD-dependent oxidoreductase [Ignavibacteriales bacterium]
MKKKAVVIGGGFAGVQAAIELSKKNIFEVTLISDRDYLYMYPISIWIPTGKLDFDDARVSLSRISDAFGFELIIDPVLKISSAENKVFCQNHILEYDYLVAAMGAHKVKHPGIENTLSICGKPEISLEIRERLNSLIEKGEGKIAVGFGGNPKDKSAVRGGPAFELLFNIHRLLEEKNMRRKFELTFFAPMKEPGERMGRNSLKLVDRMFKDLDIKKHYGVKITAFEAAGVAFEDGSKVESDLTIFIPASAGHSVLKDSDLSLSEAGFIKIDDNCLAEGTNNVYAAGDIAALEGPDWKAKQGHTAEVMARCAAENIYNSEKGLPERKGYKEHLSILCIMDTGNGAAFVYRDDKKQFAIPMPILGHWMKKGWGIYAKAVKTGRFPRIPGL